MNENEERMQEIDKKRSLEREQNKKSGIAISEARRRKKKEKKETEETRKNGRNMINSRTKQE